MWLIIPFLSGETGKRNSKKLPKFRKTLYFKLPRVDALIRLVEISLSWKSTANSVVNIQRGSTTFSTCNFDNFSIINCRVFHRFERYKNMIHLLRCCLFRFDLLFFLSSCLWATYSRYHNKDSNKQNNKKLSIFHVNNQFAIIFRYSKKIFHALLNKKFHRLIVNINTPSWKMWKMLRYFYNVLFYMMIFPWASWEKK